MSEESHEECPYVDCGSSDAFSYNTDGFGKCHSCNRSYPSKDKMFDWAKERYPTRNKLEYWKQEAKSATFEGVRGLKKDIAEKYGLLIHKDAEGKPFRYAIKWPSTIQYRTYEDNYKGPKYKFRDAGYKQVELFGPDFNAGTSKKIYLTEGAFDAASLYQLISSDKFEVPVKALPSSSISDKFIQANYDYLNSFEQIIYAGELDDPGRKCADKLYSVFPGKFYYVPMTKHKDANAFLMAGDGDELKWAAIKPQRYSPENFYLSITDFQKILKEENPYEYVPTPCEGLNELIYGHTKGGMTLYKAKPGTGKSALFRYFQYDLLKNTDQKIAVLHLEEQKSTTLRGLVSYELGVNVNTKESAKFNDIPETDVYKAIENFASKDNLILFEFKPHDYSDIFESMLNYMRIAATVYGVDYIFLDHIQRLAYMAGVEQATNNLTTFAVKSEDLCREHNLGFMAISHINNEGEAKYARALEESCIISINLERDKESEDPIESNTTRFHIPGKNRPWGKLGYGGALIYDPSTSLMEELRE